MAEIRQTIPLACAICWRRKLKFYHPVGQNRLRRLKSRPELLLPTALQEDRRGCGIR